MTTGRHLVQQSIYDDYVSRLAGKAQPPAGRQPGHRAGRARPDHRRAAADKVHDLVTASVDAGARLAAGGTFEGLFYRPTVLADVAPQMPAYASEVFGPVAPVVAVRHPGRGGQARAPTANTAYRSASSPAT